MIFHQFFDEESCTYSYLIARRRGGEALIVDPVRERVGDYLELLEILDLKLVKAIDTHLHADHITGLGALRDLTDCLTVMGAETKAELVALRVKDGDRVSADDIDLLAMHTPGHTADSYCFVLEDRVLTGDTLLIGGTGRTDFAGGDAAAQYDSLFNRLLRLDDKVRVFPGHDYRGRRVSTIGDEKAQNPRLQVPSIDAYVALMNGLNLPLPWMMDVAVPANLRLGSDGKAASAA